MEPPPTNETPIVTELLPLVVDETPAVVTQVDVVIETPPSIVIEAVEVTKISKPRTKSVSRSSRAGLVFPVARVHSRLKRRFDRVGATADVYLAGVLEYVTKEVLEAAGVEAHARKQKRIDNRSLFLAFQNDSELLELANSSRAIFPSSGVVPRASLWKRPAKKSKTPART
jgi:histone H2A